MHIGLSIEANILTDESVKTLCIFPLLFNYEKPSFYLIKEHIKDRYVNSKLYLKLFYVGINDFYILLNKVVHQNHIYICIFLNLFCVKA